MKSNSGKIIIGVITSFIFISSILAMAPTISNYTKDHNKNSFMISASNNYNTRKLSNSKYSSSPNTILNNLNFISRYMTSTLIIKEKMLKLSILGGRYDNSAKYKNDRKKKMSELAEFSHALKHVHRYADQVRVTIDKSVASIIAENKIIAKIISVIKEHPSNYATYLSAMGITIPNISFFFTSNNSLNFNNLSSKRINIYNNRYHINKSNTNFNSISLSSEEDGVNAKMMYAVGSSIYAAAFKKITFQAKIITFDNISNSYKYEIPTAKNNTINKSLKESQFKINSDKFLSNNSNNANIKQYYSSSRIFLSDINSSFNKIVNNIIGPSTPTNIPVNFNMHFFHVAEARVQYNNISSFKNNESLYIPAILTSIFTTNIIILAHAIIGIRTKVKIVARIKELKNLFRKKIETIDSLTSIEALSTYRTIHGLFAARDSQNLALDALEYDVNNLPYKYASVRNFVLFHTVPRRNNLKSRVIEHSGQILGLSRDVNARLYISGKPQATTLTDTIRDANKNTIVEYVNNIGSFNMVEVLNSIKTYEGLDKYYALTRQTIDAYHILIANSEYINPLNKIYLTDKLKWLENILNERVSVRTNQLQETVESVSIKQAEILKEIKAVSESTDGSKSYIHMAYYMIAEQQGIINSLDRISNKVELEKKADSIREANNAIFKQLYNAQYRSFNEKYSILNEVSNLSNQLNKKVQVVVKRIDKHSDANDILNIISNGIVESSKRISQFKEVESENQLIAIINDIEHNAKDLTKLASENRKLFQSSLPQIKAAIEHTRAQNQSLGHLRRLKIQKEFEELKKQKTEELAQKISEIIIHKEKNKSNTLQGKKLKAHNNQTAEYNDTIRGLEEDLDTLNGVRISNILAEVGPALIL